MQSKIIEIGLFVVFILAGALYLRSHYISQGRQEVIAEWNADRLKQAQAHNEAMRIAVSKVELEYKRQLQVNAIVINDYETKLKDAYEKINLERRAADNQRLRFQADRAKLCAATEPAKGTSTIEPNGTGEAITVELPDSIATSLRNIAENADREVTRLKAKVTAFQKWAIENGHYEVVNGDKEKGDSNR